MKRPFGQVEEEQQRSGEALGEPQVRQQHAERSPGSSSSSRLVLKIGKTGSKQPSLCIESWGHPLSFEKQREWYETLRTKGPWEQKVNQFMGKKVKQPRVAIKWGKDYSYSGVTHKATENLPEEIKAIIEEAVRLVSEILGQPFNEVIVQFYRNGSDHIMAHYDGGDFVEDETNKYSVAILNLTPHPQGTRVLRYVAWDGDEAEIDGKPVQSELVKNHKIHDIPLTPGLLVTMRGHQPMAKHLVPQVNAPTPERDLKKPRGYKAACKARQQQEAHDVGRMSISMRYFKEN